MNPMTMNPMTSSLQDPQQQQQGPEALMQTLIQSILKSLQEQDDRERANQREDRAREFSGAGGLMDVQRANINAMRGPRARANQFASSARVNRERALKTAGMPTDARWVSPPKPDETEGEYIARMRKAQTDHETNANRVRDKLRSQTQAARLRKSQTGKRGTGYVIESQEETQPDPLNPLGPPKRSKTFNTTTMVEQPNRRPITPASTNNSSVDFPGFGSGGQMMRARGLPSLEAARTGVQGDLGAMDTPMSESERRSMIAGPQSENKLRQVLMQALMGGM